MAKKDFTQNIQGADAFFSNVTLNAEPAAPAVPIAPATPVTPEIVPAVRPVKGRKPARATYVFTLHLPVEWKDYLADKAWEKRMSVTGMLNEIIGDWIEKEERKGR